MPETVPGLLQFGALGALVILLLLIYRLALPIVTTWAARKTDTPPPNFAGGSMSYQDQQARTIYDVNKTLSEVAVINQQTNEILKTVAADQQQTMRMQREHNQKSGDFIDKLGDVVLKKLG